MDNKNKFIYFLFISLSVVSISTCTSENQNNNIQTIESLTPTSLPALTPAAVAATFVADTDYLQECKNITSLSRDNQIDFLGILAGKTTEEELEFSLGPPLENSPYLEGEFWTYDEFAISLQEGIVKDVFVVKGFLISNTLEEIILEYGCPNLIIAHNPEVHPSGPNYESTFFIYYKAGVEFDFWDFPVSMKNTPHTIYFFKPQNLEGYLDESIGRDVHPNVAMPVTWNEAVK